MGFNNPCYISLFIRIKSYDAGYFIQKKIQLKFSYLAIIKRSGSHSTTVWRHIS
jgi:hypothetical protein